MDQNNPITFEELLAEERRSNAGHINRVRFFGAFGFFVLFLLLDKVFKQPGWGGALTLLAPYSALTGFVYYAATKRPKVAHALATLTIAFIDMPMVTLLQYNTLSTSPSASGVAGFTLGVVALLVALGALSLARWQIATTAIMGAICEVWLQRAAGVLSGGQIAAVLVIVLIAFTCMYASERLRHLVGRVHADMMALREMQARLVTEAVRSAKVEEEVAIAQRMQISILPKDPKLPGLEIAAAMFPATEVGGDYYDVLPQKNGGWIGIGDVAGHGLHAGLIMLLVQSAMSALSRMPSLSTPSQLLPLLNEVVYDSVRHRLQGTDHVTFTLFRYEETGRFLFAGAHQTLVVLRAATGEVEMIDTPGTWLGAMADVREVTEDGSLQLLPGDMLVLYSDGITEALNAEREPYDMGRLSDAVKGAATQSVQGVVDTVLASVKAWQLEQDDDVTLMVLRYSG